MKWKNYTSTKIIWPTNKNNIHVSLTYLKSTIIQNTNIIRRLNEINPQRNWLQNRSYNILCMFHCSTKLNRMCMLHIKSFPSPQGKASTCLFYSMLHWDVASKAWSHVRAASSLVYSGGLTPNHPSRHYPTTLGCVTALQQIGRLAYSSTVGLPLPLPVITLYVTPPPPAHRS